MTSTCVADPSTLTKFPRSKTGETGETKYPLGSGELGRFVN